MLKLRITNPSRGAVLATAADVADTSAKRRRGLLGRDVLPAGGGLWIMPCEGVHTFGMRFPIDIVFLDRQRRVRKIRPGVPRRRVVLCLLAESVLELPAGTAEATGTVLGDRLEFEKYEVS